MPRFRFGLVVCATASLAMANLAHGEYSQINLVGSQASYNTGDPNFILDPQFINAWGVSLRPAGLGGHWWVNNTDTGRVTLYVGDSPTVPFGQDALAVLPIPGAGGAPAAPTGQVFSGSATDFKVSGVSFTNAPITNVPARFISVSEDGTIAAWGEAGTTLATRMNSYAVVVDNSASGAIYKGVAISSDAGSGNRVYAANFSQGRIDTFDADWQPIATAGNFDTQGQVPATYAPFNIQRVFNSARGMDVLMVAFAKVANAAGGEEEAGAGLGHIVEFDLNGNLLAVWNDGGGLNAPWGIAASPATFGEYGNALLVANFGDGTIAAYDFATHALRGFLDDPSGNPISIDGIWDIKFGNGESLGHADRLYFAAGPEAEAQGLFGSLTPVPEPGGILVMVAGMLALAASRRCAARYRSRAEASHRLPPRSGRFSRPRSSG